MEVVNQLGEFSPQLAKLSKQIKKYWATNKSEAGDQLMSNLLPMYTGEDIMLMNLSIILLRNSHNFAYMLKDFTYYSHTYVCLI